MENSAQQNRAIVRPYSKKELCRIYHVSAGTLKKWLKAHGLIPENDFRKIFTSKEIESIFQALGVPYVE